MAALKAIPGLDILVRQALGASADRFILQTWLSSAVRVGPQQYPRLHGIIESCKETLCITKDYQAFVAYNPAANAMAAGFKDPCLIFNSSLLDLLDDDELAFVVAHELGHAESGHALYHTLLALLIDSFQLISGIGLTEFARVAIILALLEWSRKSELSADRAGLLGTQDPDAAWRTFMKLAGGRDMGQMNLDGFLQQALDYDKTGSMMDEVSKLLVLGFRTHPMPVLRLKELKIWHDGGQYQNIVDGARPLDDGSGSTAGQENAGPNVFSDLSEALRQYGNDFNTSSLAQGLGQAAKDAAGELNKFFEGFKPRQ